MPAIQADTRAQASPPPLDADRKPYILPFQPVDSPLQSVHSDFDGPRQHDSTSLRSTTSARRLSRPPTAAGGPLSSHPAHDEDFSSILGPSPTSFTTNRYYTTNAVMSSESARDTSGSFIATASPSSVRDDMHPPERRPSGVRRLFSLSSLRQSFSSSRTSLSIPPGSSYGNRHDMQGRPPTSSANASTPAFATQAESMHSSRQAPTFRKKRSSSWFKRRSGFFTVNEDGQLDVLDEDHHDTRGAKRFREARQLPVLPEVSALGGGELNDGSLGWDEQLFKR